MAKELEEMGGSAASTSQLSLSQVSLIQLCFALIIYINYKSGLNWLISQNYKLFA